MKTLIFDNSAGRLQWISNRETFGEIADWHKHGTAGAFGLRIWLQSFGRGRIHPRASLDLFREDDGTAEATQWKSAA